MYVLKPGLKTKTWLGIGALPDRIFFGHGACHILAGVFLETLRAVGIHRFVGKTMGRV